MKSYTGRDPQGSQPQELLFLKSWGMPLPQYVDAFINPKAPQYLSFSIVSSHSHDCLTQSPRPPLLPGGWGKAERSKLLINIWAFWVPAPCLKLFFPGLIGRGIEPFISLHFPPSTCTVGSASNLQIELRQLNFFSFIEMKSKTTMRYHLLEWLLSQRQEKTSVGEHVEEREPLCTSGGNVNWYS